jgi:molybdopterin-guanine dinucleotide biosynthesis protein A
MQCAVYVLTGGHSSRMGRDKALLPFRGRFLVQHVAEQAESVASCIMLIGKPNRYANLGYPVVEDIFPECGPLSGLHTALSITESEWNVVMACDMPEVTAEFLIQLTRRAEVGRAAAVIPVGPDGVPQPLCAAYRRRCADVVARALRNGVCKVTEAFAGIEIDFWPVPNSGYFRNLNTPQDWASYSHDAS